MNEMFLNCPYFHKQKQYISNLTNLFAFDNVLHAWKIKIGSCLNKRVETQHLKPAFYLLVYWSGWSLVGFWTVSHTFASFRNNVIPFIVSNGGHNNSRFETSPDLA